MEDCKKLGFEHLFKRYKGQPVEVMTDDGLRYCGLELYCDCVSLEIIDNCGRIIYIPYEHITAVVEPKMKLTPFCGNIDCKCNGECEQQSN